MSKRWSILTSLVMVLGLMGSASAELNYEYYEAAEGAQYRALADVNFADAVPLRTGTSDTLDSGNGNWVEQAGGHRNDDFAFRFSGVIVVPISGEITFYLRSDDGSQLFIDGQMVVDNDGLHGTEGFPGDPGVITLEAGAHTIVATQFERGGGDSIHVAWSAGGQAARRVPDSVLFLEAPADISGIAVDVLVSQKVFDPVPADGSVDVVDADVALLTWSPGFGSVSFDVYISGNAEIVAGDLAGTVDAPEYAVTDPLVPGVTYYWRVDAVDADGVTHEGDVWMVTALGIEAHFPVPSDGATLQAIDVQLGWAAGLDALVRDVYFSTDLALVEARDASVKLGFFLSDPALDPGLLENETTYYWAVDEIDSTFSPNPGPVWSFTTVFGIPILDENLIGWWSFDGVEGGVILDQSGHGNTGVEVGTPEYVDGVLGQAISLDGSQAVDLGLNDSFNPTGSFTVALWANATAWNNNWGHAMMGNRGESGIGWQVRRFGGNPNASFTTRGIGNDDNPQSNVPMPLNEWVHVGAVYDNANNTKTMYFNGASVGQVETNPGSVNPTSHNVYIGARANGGNSGPEAFFTGSLDDVRYYDIPLNQVEIVALAMPTLADVTGPNDVVVGVPDEARDGSVAGWPGGEHPALAIDDNTGTKYLHFKGEVEPTGFRVAPDMGLTLVTGLTFTTANDSAPRDPATYELSGSNESLDGPYELIASGDIVDFAQAAELPRFTKNSTAIMFDNDVAYLYYQVMFPTVRDAAAANSMQIAEVELLGQRGVALPVSINFQQTGGDVPEGYLPDGGEVFADRGNGYSYGWNIDSTGGARNRNNAAAPDERYDTTQHLEKGEHRVWEIELPNGTYDLFVAAGDVNHTDQINTLDIEGTVVVDPDGGDNFDEYTLTVEVTDGRLTIQMADGASNAKIMFIDIMKAVEAAQVVLFEDFEGLALGPNVDEGVAGDQVWTDTPPEGWAVDESGVPGIGDPATDGVTEWAGWSFADKAWWVEAAGDQDRGLFALGDGTVAVADPDEWDDDPHDDSAAGGWYKTFLQTPAIDISALEAGSLQLVFDSSWRPEFDSNYHQTANVTASYDGGAPVEVLLWESDSASANFKPYATNETVFVDLQNPAGAGSVVLTFGLFDAGNDWWWAIDNVEVSGMGN